MYLIGVDDVGTGSYAGPICVCAVRIEKDSEVLNNLSASKIINDSKRLSAKKRNTASKLLNELKIKQDIEYTIILKSNQEIDELGLGNCLKQAYKEVIESLLTEDSEVILDGQAKISISKGKLINMIKADSQVPCVMAASVLAKVHRDNLMMELHQEFPQYGWSENVGYITPGHKQAIKEFGLSEFHRKSYNVRL